MVTIKRYIGKVRKPLYWRGRRQFARNILLPSVTAVALLCLVRWLLVAQFALSADLPEAGLLAGDRLLVARTAYGLRWPFGEPPAAPRNAAEMPQRGEVAAFVEGGGEGGAKVGVVTALPGDTIVRDGHRYVLPEGLYAAGERLVPHAALLGRVVAVAYSVDDDAPLTDRLRTGRVMLRIGPVR